MKLKFPMTFEVFLLHTSGRWISGRWVRRRAEDRRKIFRDYTRENLWAHKRMMNRGVLEWDDVPPPTEDEVQAAMDQMSREGVADESQFRREAEWFQRWQQDLLGRRASKAANKRWEKKRLHDAEAMQIADKHSKSSGKHSLDAR